MNTYLFVTTQTSATDSILRILARIGDFDFIESKYIDKVLQKLEPKDLLNMPLPLDGKLHRFNLPPFFNPELIKAEHKVVINYRDPRDYLCNAYHWQFSHPTPNLTEEQRERKLEKARQQTIDQFVIERAAYPYFDNIIKTLKMLEGNNMTVLTYARLCTSFDSFLLKAAEFFEVELSLKMKESLEVERVSNLHQNKDYIGNKWAGSDVMPGRYKRELKQETIDILNDRFKETLSVMAKFDPDFADLYSIG